MQLSKGQNVEPRMLLRSLEVRAKKLNICSAPVQLFRYPSSSLLPTHLQKTWSVFSFEDLYFKHLWKRKVFGKS